MSNTYTAALSLPDQDSAISGGQIFATDIKKTVDSLNWAHAHVGTGTLYSGAFSDRVFQTADTTSSSGATLRVRIPVISSHHTTLQVLTVHSGGGTLDLSINDGSSTTISNITLSNTGSLSTSAINTNDLTGLTLGSNGYLTLEIGLTAASASPSHLRVNNITFRWKPLASPLPTTQATLGSNTYTPFAPARFDSDTALPSFLGHTMIDNIKALRERPRVYYNFCGLGTIYNRIESSVLVESSSFRGLTRNSPISTRALDYIFQNADDFDDKLQVHLYTKNFSSSFSVRICGHLVTVSSGGWSNYEIDLPLRTSEYSSEIGLPVYEFGPSSSQGLPTVTTGAIIQSLAIWGP